MTVPAGLIFSTLLTLPAAADFTLLMRYLTGGTDGNPGSTTEAESIIALAAPNASYAYTDYSDTRNTINVGDGSIGTADLLPNGSAKTDTYVLRATANLVIPAGTWSLGFKSDDGGRLIVPGITFDTKTNATGTMGADQVRFEGTRGSALTWGSFTLASPLSTTIDALMFESGGGDGFQVVFAAGNTAPGTLLANAVNGWTVQVAPLVDTDPPVISGLSPADDSAGAYPAAPLVATFNEEIALGASGIISVTDTTDGTGSFTIDLSALPDPDAAISVSGSKLTIVPASNLEFATAYEVSIPAGAIQDTWSTPNPYGGTASGEWTFTTASQDLTAPVIVPPTSPADGDTGVFANAVLTANFDEDILLNSSALTVLLDEGFEAGGGSDGGFAPAGSPNDWARGTPNSDNSAGLVITSGNNGSANCWATVLGTGGSLSGTITTGSNSILQGPGGPVAGGTAIDLATLATAQLQFAAAVDADTGDTIEVVVRDVTDNSALVTLIPFAPPVSAGWAVYGPFDITDAVGKQVYLEFRYVGGNDSYIGLYIDDVKVTGLGATNVITLKDLTNLTDTVIPVNDGAQVSVSGSTLTITPTVPLASLADYAVQIGSTAIRNYSDVYFAGIGDTTTWNFTTAGPRDLTWDPAGGGASDGNGVWLGAGEWWDGSANVDWINATPDNAVIGSGGAGGTITVGDVTAGSVLIDKFSGTYTLQGTGTTLTQGTGITVGASAGNVTLRGTGGTTSRLTITGDGGITINGSGVLFSWQNLVLTYTGPTVINSGIMMFYQNLPTGSNFTLNNGMVTDYYRQNNIFANGLGTGAGQIQIYGDSGFGSGNGNANWRIGAINSVLQWGSTYFNPSKLKLRAPADNNGPSIYGQVTLQNGLDLNGGVRTIDVLAGTGANATLNAWGNIAGAIVDNSVGGGGSLIKTGGGILRLSGANTYTGGTTVENGILTINGSLADATMAIKPGATVNGTGTLNFNVSGATIDQIVMTGGTLTATALTVNVNGSLTQPEYVIVDATAGGTISGTFAGLTGAPGYALDYGTANQVKLVGPGTTSPYDNWATGGELFDEDANGDGVSNGLAFLLGASGPNVSALDKLPTAGSPTGFLTLDFTRENPYSPAKLYVEYGNDLAGWTKLELPAGSATIGGDIEVLVTAGDPDVVQIKIPTSHAAGGKLFARLSATEN